MDLRVCAVGILDIIIHQSHFTKNQKLQLFLSIGFTKLKILLKPNFHKSYRRRNQEEVLQEVLSPTEESESCKPRFGGVEETRFRYNVYSKYLFQLTRK